MAQIATSNSEDALDILQDAMYKLVQKYADKDPTEWGPLFHTTLQSRIKDYYRRNAVRNKFRVWFGKPGDEDDNDPIQSAEDVFGSRPDDEIDRARSMDKLDEAIRQLPARQ